MRISRTSVSTSPGPVNPGATKLANGRAKTISNAMPILPTTRIKFATTLSAFQPPSRSLRSRYSTKIGMNTIDSAPAVRQREARESLSTGTKSSADDLLAQQTHNAAKENRARPNDRGDANGARLALP